MDVSIPLLCSTSPSLAAFLLTFKGLLFDCCHSPVRGSFNRFPPPLPTSDGFSRLFQSNLVSSCRAPAECFRCQTWGLVLARGATSQPSSSSQIGAALAFSSVRKTQQHVDLGAWSCQGGILLPSGSLLHCGMCRTTAIPNGAFGFHS